MASNITRYINWMERRNITDSWRRSYVQNVSEKSIDYVVDISRSPDFRTFINMSIGKKEAETLFWRKNIARYESSGEKGRA